MYIKEHYSELAKARGMSKAINGKVVSNHGISKYAEALNIYETTSESLKSISQRLGLIYNSLWGFIRRNYPEAIEKHKSLLTSSDDRFKEGIRRLQESDVTINTVIKEFGYNEYFRMYVKANHPELLERKTQRRKIVATRVAAEKYAAAIKGMQTETLSLAEAAEKFGVNIHSFRKYIYKHRPELMGRRIN